MSASERADDLIRQYGDQAYHRGVRLVVAAVHVGDRAFSREISQANIELLQRGYHKKPEARPE